MLTISKQSVKNKLALIAAGTALAIGAATPVLAQTPAQRLCNVGRVCTVKVNASNGVTIYSGAGFHCKKIGTLRRGYEATVIARKSSREWLKLGGRSGWIHYRNLQKSGDFPEPID
jgi:hypothetical protein